MFCNSTQKRFWMFDNPQTLVDLRMKANMDGIKDLIKEGKSPDSLLSQDEELDLVQDYLVQLRSFCGQFEPAMPKSVIATAFLYMKRFYLNESCMKYEVKNIAITCAFLAAKIDEFYLSIDQFVEKTNGNRKKAQDIILSNELLLMKKLKFHLTVHLPYRAKEGFFIDLRARFQQVRDKLRSLEPLVEEYLENAMYTDACFLFTPSQIALAAIYNTAKTINLEPYLSDILFEDEPKSLMLFKSAAAKIDKLVQDHVAYNSSKEQEKNLSRIKKKLKELSKDA